MSPIFARRVTTTAEADCRSGQLYVPAQPFSDRIGKATATRARARPRARVISNRMLLSPRALTNVLRRSPACRVDSIALIPFRYLFQPLQQQLRFHVRAEQFVLLFHEQAQYPQALVPLAPAKRHSNPRRSRRQSQITLRKIARFAFHFLGLRRCGFQYVNVYSHFSANFAN